MIPTERPETLAMVWPRGARPTHRGEVDPAYVLRRAVDRKAFCTVQKSIGFEVTEEVWLSVRRGLADEGMVLGEIEKTGVPVAVAVAERRQNGWLELGWVAVSPEHRGCGIGFRVCAALVTTLLNSGKTQLFGSTQDKRLSALNIYFRLGFHPLFRDDKVERWRKVCDELDVPYAPAVWGWPTRSSSRV